ncbi:MAG: SUMF1/EgtB/PvdO family nonheme iron enzyme [Candidatus Hydrogenedentes bacterium]|nr:SUMF1/EgtB/PvdO family nonheme iron enzyme [Candidatus Hydrogenedentota bacterium]
MCFGCGARLLVPHTANGDRELDLQFEPGHRISDRYVIEAPIGKGGMGMVYRAHDTLMNERVALKFLDPRIVHTQKGVKLFIQEAQVARRLRHENVVAVHDVSATPEGILYISMEYLQGQSLRAFLRNCRNQRRLVDVRLAVTLTAQILAALDYAHRIVIHRDIKPENVMLLAGEHLKVLDFGLAKVVDEECLFTDKGPDGKPTRVVGTEAYASPEQLRHAEIDSRADLYSVGLIFRELLNLRTPLDDFVEVTAVGAGVAPYRRGVIAKGGPIPRGDPWQTPGGLRANLLKAFDESYRATLKTRIEVEPGREVSTDGMVFLEGGSFLMGNNGIADEAPEFETTVEPFYIDAYPVTNAQFEEFLRATGRPNPKLWGIPDYRGADQPVIGVTWEDAAAYAAWAGKALPSEAQWEYAARGKENRKYPWGHQEPDAHKANYRDFLNMPSIVSMHEEGKTPDNVYDLAGNVYEWTADLFLPYDTARREAAARTGPPKRAIRGGSWRSKADELRCAARKGLFPESALPTVGFRCVLPIERAQR